MHGIIVQLPLPDGFDRVTESIDPRKDVDGFHSSNLGQLAKRDCEPLFVPCTPRGCLELLDRSGRATPFGSLIVFLQGINAYRYHNRGQECCCGWQKQCRRAAHISSPE